MEYSGVKIDRYTPELVAEVAVLAVEDKNVGIAYTYNEPLIGYEFIIDCSKLIRNVGLMNVLVTNGYINKEPLVKLLPHIDALNVDIKGNDERTYNMVGGTQAVVKNTIETAAKLCHVEVTTLVIPNENEDSVEDIAQWLATIDKSIPYHLSRFFPRYNYSGSEPTPPETMYKLYEAARKHLENVYLGNM
jgi:pyruvate formate lyase activating enzyme